MMKRINAIVLSALLFGCCVGCSGDTVVTDQVVQKETSFSWWGNDIRHDYTLAAIETFESLHPDIKVKCHYSEWSGYQTRNDVRMVTHTESDVMQINYAWLNQYSNDGEGYYDINQLSDYVDLSNFTEEDLAYGMKNGKLNAVPIALNTMTVYVNKSVYDEYGLDIPETWDDFFAAAEVMNGEHYPISMSKKSAWFFLASYVGQMTGKNLMDDEGNITFGEEEAALMIKTYCDLVNKKVMPQVEYFDKLEIANGSYAGVLAWLSDAESYCGEAIANGYEISVANYTTINGNLSSWYAKPATMYTIRKDAENPREAAILLDYLLNSPEMASYQQIEKGTPLSIAARQYLEENDMLNGIQYEAFTKMSESKDKLEVISPYFENDAMIDAFMDACNEVLFSKSDEMEQGKVFLENLTLISDSNK